MTMQGRHKAIQVMKHIILIAAAVYTLSPLALLLFNSFKPNNEIIESLVAWAMVRSKSVLVKIMYFGFTAAMLIPFQSLMYPLLDIFEKIGMKNIPGLIFMYGGFGVSMSVFLYHRFIKSVPQSLEEAAIIDGANLFQMFFKVVFPLLKSTTVMVIALNGMWIWNDYLLPFLVIGNSPCYMF